MKIKIFGRRSKKWFVQWRTLVNDSRFERTDNKLMLTRLENIQLKDKLQKSEKQFTEEITKLRTQLNSLLHGRSDVNTNEITTESMEREKNEKNKVWNRVIAIHAMKLIENKKKQFEQFLQSKSAIDPCSVRYQSVHPLTVSRDEYYQHLLSLSVEKLILLWVNSTLERFISKNRKTKSFQKVAHLLGFRKSNQILSQNKLGNETSEEIDDSQILKVTNFSKDFTDGKIYVCLFHALWPESFNLSILQVI